MIHPKFGTKHSCYVCATKFYDMKKPDPKCPKCGADPREDPALKSQEKGSRRDRDDPYAEDLEGENFEADMDDLVHDDDSDAEEESEPEEMDEVDEEV